MSERPGPANEDLFARCFNSSPTALLLIELRAPMFPIVNVNSAAATLFGREASALCGSAWEQAFGSASPFAEILQGLRDRVAVPEALGTYTRDSDPPFWCQLRLRIILSHDGIATHALCIASDVSQQIDNEASRNYLATYDTVSDLPRIHVYEENLSAELARAIHHCYRLLMCYVNVDRFGVINETYGFDFGDRLIHCIADRLAECAGSRERVCRLAGDEFVLAVPDLNSDTDQWELAQRMLDALSEPIVLDEIGLRLTASIGVACFPDTATSVHELMQQASVAAREAKRENGGDSIRVFSKEQRDELDERLRIGAHLRNVVERDELELHYQPVIDAGKREIVGMEALVRWRSPQLGLVMPERFISLAEDFGMIAELGQWVLLRACTQARSWLDQGVGDFILSVNVSGLQMRGQQLVEDVNRALDKSRLPARLLELELAEDVIMTNVEHVTAVMRELRKIGVKLAMDDFGIGQSSLGHLQRLPVNRLKIDRSFVAAVPDDVSAARISRAVIGLAHEFGFTVVAEGVEKPVQLAFLERNGCEFVQGNFFSVPVPADAMLAMLRRPELRPREEMGDDQGGTILLVDDEQNVLRALARLLRRDGYKIFTASTFKDAFEILGTQPVHVVVSDHRMPDGKGTEFLGRVKETHPHTVRMILSGYADLGVVTEAINGGAVYRFLTKPWNDDELRKTLHEAMRMARQDSATEAES
ncbi:EAL domain-containing protein [Oleiagrimonas soli]|uniref:Diguanylate cyclase (GGDEF)-like protein n=1 Tax=Oleiagrimonas soli TaxID=1543381 RepID=A0A841KMK4_9GAMM|nr:EAL domain-containing protein [Oleiagrimonas soli]MBB6183288.1 diguanylate cyclase (GGDEF)-like protein [Oleiagrimonas soli]